MKSVVLFVVIAFMFLAVDAAYGLGGGGGKGDGRLGFSQGVSNGSPANSNAQGAFSASNGNTGGSDNGSVLNSVPEPLVLSLLGLGIAGLVGIGLRRKFRK